MAVYGILTDEGLENSQASRTFAGWSLRPIRFAISETMSIMSSTRTAADMNEIWYQADIEEVISINDELLEMTLVIPRGHPAAGIKAIGEIYIIGQLTSGGHYLMGIAQIIETGVLTKGSGSEIRFSVSLVLRKKSEIDKLEISYNYDIGVSTTTAQDLMKFLEAGDNIKLSLERNKVRVDVISPWPVNPIEPDYELNWETYGDVLSQILQNNERYRIRAEGSLSSLGGGCSVKLVMYDGHLETTLDRRDYTDGAVAGEPILFDHELQAPAVGGQDIKYYIQTVASNNVTVEISNLSITYFQITSEV